MKIILKITFLLLKELFQKLHFKSFLEGEIKKGGIKNVFLLALKMLYSTKICYVTMVISSFWTFPSVKRAKRENKSGISWHSLVNFHFSSLVQCLHQSISHHDPPFNS
jgi:hypothetical protein